MREFTATAAMRGLNRLFRLPLALMNGTAALAGYLLHPGRVDAAAAGAVFGGVVLMAAASSVFNQVLERDLDRMMRRTCDRPLPAGELQPFCALLIGGATLTAGVFTLAAWGGIQAPLLALATLGWYLVLYTPLKTRTTLALLLGALCGAVPPLIGWGVAGGSLSDFRIVLLAGILYLWQVPHFWMLQRRHADDYRRAGVPLFAPEGSRAASTLLRLWLTAMVAASLMLPAFGLIGRNAPLWCLAFSLPLLLSPFRRLEAAANAGINLFPALITLALYVSPAA